MKSNRPSRPRSCAPSRKWFTTWWTPPRKKKRKPRTRLRALKVSAPPLAHRANAFLMILGSRQPALLGELMVGLAPDGFGDPAPHGRARRFDSQRRSFRDFGCQFH